MVEANEKIKNFLEELLNNEKVQDLENHDDQGVKITAHTYDVLRLSIDDLKRTYGDLEEAKKEIDFFSIIVGVIVHDLSKGTLRKANENISHSQVMTKNPEYIIKETENLLREIENRIKRKIKLEVRRNIIHIVVSHHGKWGKIMPTTKEANLVHWADMYSAKYHRINPLNVNDILSDIAKGRSITELVKAYNSTSGIIKDRMKKARIELKIGTDKQLLNYYRKNKKVPIGDEFFTKRIEETSKLIKAVEKNGFKSLVETNELLNYLEDKDVFESV